MVERIVELGDQFKYRDGTIVKVVAMGKVQVIVEIIKPGEHGSGYRPGDEMPDSIKNLGGNAFIEKIEPWFEVGKTYRMSPHFDMRVEAIIERGGKRAAACSYYATDENRIGFITWDSFKGWQEI